MTLTIMIMTTNEFKILTFNNDDNDDDDDDDD